MMVVLEQVIFITFYFLILAATHFFGNVIQTYHRNKPLGLQTLHGKILEDIFIPAWTGTATSLVTMMVVGEIVGPLSKELAMLFAVIDYVSLVTIQIALFFVILTKYLTIYHGPLINSLDEKDALQTVKVLVALVPFTLALMEYCFLTPMEESLTFQTKHFGLAKPEARGTKGKFFGIIFDALLLLISQARIEYGNISRNETHGCLAFIKRAFVLTQNQLDNPVGVGSVNENESDASLSISSNVKRFGYNIRILRIAFAIGIASVSIVVYHVASGTADQYRKLTFVVIYAINCIVGPYLFIRNHKGMSKIAKNKLVAPFAKFRTI